MGLGGFDPEHWPKPRDGWTVSIEGGPSTKAHFLSMASFGRRNATTDQHVQAVNAIPALCAAEPGWRSSIELGLLRRASGSVASRDGHPIGGRPAGAR